jgi:hypothetical protein
MAMSEPDAERELRTALGMMRSRTRMAIAQGRGEVGGCIVHVDDEHATRRADSQPAGDSRLTLRTPPADLLEAFAAYRAGGSVSGAPAGVDQPRPAR